MTERRIQIAGISGSVREGSFTRKALALVHDELQQSSDVTAEILDARDIPFAPPGVESNAPELHRFQQTVRDATGVVLATPEYHGSYSSVVKLAIENLGFPSGLSGKPVALLGVAAGQIGAIKALEHLSSVCSHVGAIVLPGPVSIANVQKTFDDEGHCLDSKVEQRVRRLARNLLEYIHSRVCPAIALEAMARGR